MTCDTALAKPGVCTLLPWGRLAGEWLQTSYFSVAAPDLPRAKSMVWHNAVNACDTPPAKRGSHALISCHDGSGRRADGGRQAVAAWLHMP